MHPHHRPHYTITIENSERKIAPSDATHATKASCFGSARQSLCVRMRVECGPPTLPPPSSPPTPQAPTLTYLPYPVRCELRKVAARGTPSEEVLAHRRRHHLCRPRHCWRRRGGEGKMVLALLPVGGAERAIEVAVGGEVARFRREGPQHHGKGSNDHGARAQWR